MSDVEICPPEVDMSEKRYDSMKNCYLVKELGDKKGTLNLEVGAYFTPFTGQQRPVRVQSGQQP